MISISIFKYSVSKNNGCEKTGNFAFGKLKIHHDMKKLCITFVFMFLGLIIFGQYETPGTGVNWTLNDLVDNSSGVVSLESNGQYRINGDLTISANDTLSILFAAEINVAEAVLVTVGGTLLSSPQDFGIVFFKALDNHYLGFRFEDNEGSWLERTYFKRAGGIRLVSSFVVFQDCDFSEFDQEYSTGTINLSQSSPLIQGCSFSDNYGPAVMSGANSTSSPQIIDCAIIYNVASNENTPQINLGTSDTDSIRILNCEIIGNPDNMMAGGIAITTLAGGSIKARIEGNVIKNNRYGITAYGSNIGSVIRGNEIRDNNTQNLPMSGGSGINFFGNETNQSLVSGNIITGNLWGITIQNTAQPNLGQLEGAILNPGVNTIMENGNDGEIYDLYNNTPNPIMAQNNYWGTDDPDEVEDHIFHQPDNPSLGLVEYLPLYSPPVGMNKQLQDEKTFSVLLFPNPSSGIFNLHHTEDIEVIEVMDSYGKLIISERPGFDMRVNLSDYPTGTYFLKAIATDGSESTHKLIVQ
jgi:parallel beta-helix repeat protein